MQRATSIIQVSIVVLVLLSALFLAAGEANAQGTDRSTTIVVSYEEYKWWLISWEDNQIQCTIFTDHEGLPTPEEVFLSCGAFLANIWINTPPCVPAAKGEGGTSECVGLYLYLASVRQTEKDVFIELPPATVWVTLEGCDPNPPSNICPEIPQLVLIGEEPLPDEYITSIHGTYDGEPFTCNSDRCVLTLTPTGLKGVTIDFWADSSYGDSSEKYSALVRIIDTGVPVVPGAGGWYVDVISTQWLGEPIATCSQIWGAFPPLGEPPDWLATPNYDELLATDEPYYYLAGRLISQGVVDASDCTTGGLLTNGYADTCGLEKSAPILAPWQNQFDKRIIDVAVDTRIPAQLIKNLFAQESQFWPGVFRVPYEFGLGQITDNGADSILLWDETFYDLFCPLVLAEESCSKGYLHLSEPEQQILRGAVALQANTDCAECPTGIDLSETQFSVLLFANTLVANCSQINQTIYNATELSSGSVSTYEDLWRFTVANYHAGAGCTSYAIHNAWQNTGQLTWEEVSTRFTKPCQGVIPYVEKITDIR